MACGRCGQRRENLVTAAKAAVAGDAQIAKANIAEAARTFSEDAGKLAQAARAGLNAAHARLKR